MKKVSFVMKPDVVFEISYECGNKVGGIHTVITSKSGVMNKNFNKYVAIGYFDQKSAVKEFKEEDPPKNIEKFFGELKDNGVTCHYGKWVSANNSTIILVEQKFSKDFIDKIKKDFWEKFKIDSLYAPDDYVDPMAWSYACGMLLEKLSPAFSGHEKNSNKVLCHFHEWLSGGGLLYLKMKNVPIKTVFTTHATVLGRAKANISDLKQEVEENREKVIDINDAYRCGVQAKHLMEKTCAEHADAFTVVSELVAEEAKYILGKSPDVVTINGLDFSKIPSIGTLEALHPAYRKVVTDFLVAYFSPYYPINLKDYTLLFTASRFEFKNKGVDILIDALSELNKRLENSDKIVIAFIFIPTEVTGPKRDVMDNLLAYKHLAQILNSNLENVKENVVMKLMSGENVKMEDVASNKIISSLNSEFFYIRRKKGSLPELSAFNIKDEENNPIIRRLRERNLTNEESGNVKVIYYPVYLSSEDAQLGLDYQQTLIASTVGVFLSRYEPFGYAPLETAVYRNMCLMLDYSGFGECILKNFKNHDGIYVMNTKNKTHEEIVQAVTDNLEIIAKMSKDEKLLTKLSARKISENFDWNKLIENYLKAYELALKKKNW